MAKVVFKQGSGHLPELFLENVFDKIPDNSGQSTPDFRTMNDFRGKILKDKIQ